MPLGGSCEPLAQLHRARLILVDHRGLVIQGVEESWRCKQCTDHRQALWCWPVDPREAAQHDGRDAIDLEEEKACIADASDPVWGKAPRSIDERNTGMPLLAGQTRRIDCSTSDPVAARRASMRSVGPNPGGNRPEETGVGARVKVWSSHMGSREK